MTATIEYCFVIDTNEKPLSPTNINKGWYLIRKNKATLKEKYPMLIQLYKSVNDEDVDESEIVLGIDDGSMHVGIGLVQNGEQKQKAVFKAEIEHRNNVKDLMDIRRGYRRYRRNHKRYRCARFNNRAASKKQGRIAPSIKQKKEAILRVINKLKKCVRISKIVLEDVAIDIRALTEGFKPYKWQYQKSNRLDENLRKATLKRDNFKCQKCGAEGCILEAHHITPKRYNGADTIVNLITLCTNCHKNLADNELHYAESFYEIIKGKNIRFDYAQHVMQGKTYLRKELSKIANLELTIGAETANRRIDYGIEKSHANDALVIARINNNTAVDICSLKIRPMRRKSKAKTDMVNGFKHRDLVKYIKRNGESYTGWITALYPDKNQCNITTLDGKSLKRYGMKSLSLLWRFNNLYFLRSDV